MKDTMIDLSEINNDNTVISRKYNSRTMIELIEELGRQKPEDRFDVVLCKSDIKNTISRSMTVSDIIIEIKDRLALYINSNKDFIIFEDDGNIIRGDYKNIDLKKLDHAVSHTSDNLVNSINNFTNISALKLDNAGDIYTKIGTLYKEGIINNQQYRLFIKEVDEINQILDQSREMMMEDDKLDNDLSTKVIDTCNYEDSKFKFYFGNYIQIVNDLKERLDKLASRE